MTNITKIKKGETIIPIEQPIAIRCEFCPVAILKVNEPDGKLHYMDGLPACAKCRILKKSKHADDIKADKPKVDEDAKLKEKLLQDEADQDIRVIAYESQIATKTSINKAKK